MLLLKLDLWAPQKTLKILRLRTFSEGSGSDHFFYDSEIFYLLCEELLFTPLQFEPEWRTVTAGLAQIIRHTHRRCKQTPILILGFKTGQFSKLILIFFLMVLAG